MPSATKKPPAKKAEARDDQADQFRYGESPEELQALWEREFEAADKELGPWHKQAQEVEDVYLDQDRTGNRKGGDQTDKTNMFTADTINVEALMYGRTPRTDVTRRDQDAGDEVGRCAGTMMQRILNSDIERPDDRFARSCGYSLSDHLRANFGLVRFRYEFRSRKVAAQPAATRPDPQTGEMVEAAPAVEEHEEKVWEDVPTEYVHWRDVKWSPCRVWEDARWVAFRVQMTRTALVKRFKKKGERVPLNSKRIDRDEGDQPEGQPRFPWDRADVWEIWAKEKGKVYWMVEGHKRILDVVDDPLELKDFWPCPRPLVAWVTTTRFVPKPEYLIAQDRYRSIEKLTTRIDMLRGALRVIGIYDENFEALQELFESTDENTMVPVANWSAVSEKGGVDGVVSWFPLEQVVLTLKELVVQREAEIALCQQITGSIDVQRGQIDDPSETATATRGKMKFASKRLQRKQDAFAEFVSDAQRIRGEIIAKHFDAQTILVRSNIQFTDDAHLADQAVQLIKEEGLDGFRITVRSETLSLPDFAEMKQERTEFMTAVGGVLASIGKLPPVALPVLPEIASILKWYSSGFRGATEVEAAMDRMVQKLQKIADNPPQQQGEQPDMSKVEAQKLKNEGDQARIQAEARSRSQEIAQESQAKKEEIELQAQLDSRQEQERQQLEAQRESMEHGRELQREEAAGAREERRGSLAFRREDAQDAREHERALEAEQAKAKTGIEQLRLKGQQAVKAASVKAKAQKKPGGK